MENPGSRVAAIAIPAKSVLRRILAGVDRIDQFAAGVAPLSVALARVRRYLQGPSQH